jgi:hypothetical protein
MSERVTFIEHKGKEILYLNLSDCSSEVYLETIEQAKGIIRNKPENSLLVLTYMSNSENTQPEVFHNLRYFVKNNKPHVKASAIIGVNGVHKMLVESLQQSTGRVFGIFEDEEEAKDWLVKQ